MKLEQISKETISTISNSELVNLHWRIHQLWAQRKYKKMNISLLKGKHTIVKNEMIRRGLRHTEHAMRKVMAKLETYLEDID